MPASSPTESRPTRGPLDAEHRLAEGGAEEGELDEVLGAHLDVGADVEEEHGLAGDRQLHGERRALHAPQAAQAEGRRRHRRPGRAGADHRVGAALGDVAGGPHDRGLLPGPHGGHRVLVVADPLARRDDLDPVDAVQAQLRRRPEDAQSNPVRGRHPGALGQHVEALLGAEAVEGDGDATPRRHRYSVSGAGAVGSTIECSITSRPL